MGKVVSAAFPKTRLRPIHNTAPSVEPFSRDPAMIKRMVELRVNALHAKLLEPIDDTSAVKDKKPSILKDRVCRAAWMCGEGVVYVAQCLKPLINESGLGFAEAARILGYDWRPAYPPHSPRRPIYSGNDPVIALITGRDW